MPNWVIVCHGGPDPDAGPVEVPPKTELTFWVNEGQPALVDQARLILKELISNPADVRSLQALIDRVWGPKVRWNSVHGTGGQWVQALVLHGDPAIDCVGVLDLEQRTFARWNTLQPTTLKKVLQTYTGNVHLICCR